MKQLLTLITLATLLVSTSTTAPAYGKGERQACFRTCVDCRSRCKGNEDCKRTCYQIKRSCCASNGYGGGPNLDCTCT